MKKRSLLLVVALCCAIGSMLAQRTIQGTITDQDGVSLIGASILAEGTNTGTVTDIDGNYELQLPDGATILIVSYTGFSQQKVEIGTSNIVDVTLQEDIAGLEEIVVIGFTPQRRKDITGAVTSVSGADLVDVPNVNVESALQGRTAGVAVTKASGTPGGGIDVRVRGSTSILASNRPLFVVDGVPMIDQSFSQVGVGGGSVSSLADLNPDDIESIEVLKDAASAAIYGSRGANGVVLITTKKGKAGNTQIGFSANYGTQEAIKTIPVVSGPQYQEYLAEVFSAFQLEYADLAPLLSGGLKDADNDWQSEIFQQSLIQEYSANIQGGDEKTKFYANIGYFEDEGIIKNSGFERFSGRLNLDHVASEKVSFGMNMSYTNSNTNRIQNDNNIFGALSTAILLPPTVNIREEDGSYGSAFGLENPVAAVTEYRNILNRGRMIGNVYASYFLTPELSVKATVGLDVLDLREDIFQPSLLQSSNNGTVTVGTTANRRFTHDYNLIYNKGFDRSNLVALVGIGFQEDKINQVLAVANDFPTTQFSGLSAGATPTTTNGSFTGDNLRSYYGNINYSFADKYIVTGVFRVDGSSRFINEQFGYFPGLSVAWRLSEEDFLNNSGILNDLKLRAGWGITGNNAIGNFQARQLYAGGNNYLDLPGIAPSQLGNPDLKWETTTTYNVGLDFGFGNSRISGSVDVYLKNTEDLLLNRPIPTTSGFTIVPQNIGEVQNRGIDITLNTINVVSSNGLNWNTTFTFNYNQNEVLKLVDGVPIDQGFATRIAEGQPIGAFFGNVTDGIFQNQAEIDAAASQPNAAPGDIRFKDISGGAGPDGILGTADDLAPDGIINDDDRDFIGNAIPDFTGGLTNRLSFKGIDLEFFFQYALGHEIYNNNLAFAEGLNSVFAPTVRAWENRWQQEGDQTNIPRLVRNDPNGNRRDSDRFVEDADYVRLKNITFGYNLPPNVLDRIGVRRLRLYVAGQNLLTFTNYSWLDPEVNTFDGNNTALGTDFLTFPQAKSIVFGVNLGF
ncbi:MAG: TonB-dependent receptor [Bacteroidota bacterium]